MLVCFAREQEEGTSAVGGSTAAQGGAATTPCPPPSPPEAKPGSDVGRGDDKSSLIAEGQLVEDFLGRTASQLTFQGLTQLYETVRENELCVFFRNNHFSTLFKYEGRLYLLVTDQGYLHEDRVVWERLDEVRHHQQQQEGRHRLKGRPEGLTASPDSC